MKKIILELTPEEIKLLAYGAIPKEFKKRLQEIAYYLEDQDKLDASLVKIKKDRDSEKANKQYSKKRYKCQKCGRPINHKGKCLPCNMNDKSKRK